ncbi:hypothetical protein FQN54_005304 [Arachnomyces sp. PD_36]|nr:hypothetical protein FQN54_005304 [Arachnomyces sp. PD_36]
MKSLANTLFASALTTVVQAVNPVTPVLDDRGCAAYPLYGPGTGFVAHFAFTPNQCVDPITQETCSIEGWDTSIEGIKVEGQEHITSGYITIVGRKDEASGRLQCTEERGVEALTIDPTGGETDYSFNKIAVANRPKAANLMWGLPEEETIPIEPYHHVIDGEEQEGTFLGSQNVTTWAIKQLEGGQYEDWIFRLLLPGGETLQDGESKTFLKVGYE